MGNNTTQGYRNGRGEDGFKKDRTTIPRHRKTASTGPKPRTRHSEEEDGRKGESWGVDRFSGPAGKVIFNPAPPPPSLSPAPQILISWHPQSRGCRWMYERRPSVGWDGLNLLTVWGRGAMDVEWRVWSTQTRIKVQILQQKKIKHNNNNSNNHLQRWETSPGGCSGPPHSTNRHHYNYYYYCYRQNMGGLVNFIFVF